MASTLLKKKRHKSKAVLREFSSKPCLICGAKSDACHVRSRGSGGSDEAENLLSLCRSHHVEQHRIGIATFAERHPAVEEALKEKGWTTTKVFGQKKLVRK